MNLGELLEQVKDAIRVQQADSQAATAINAAYVEVVGRLRLLQKITTLTATTSQPSYTWAELGAPDLSAVISLDRTILGLSDAASPARQVDQQELTLSSASSPLSWPRETLYVLLGSGGVAFYPQLAVGETITIHHAYRPTELASEEDTPDAIPAEHHDLLVDGALARLWRMVRGGQKDAAACRQLFEQGLRRLQADIATIGGETPTRVRVGYPSLVRAARDNDWYGSGV